MSLKYLMEKLLLEPFFPSPLRFFLANNNSTVFPHLSVTAPEVCNNPDKQRIITSSVLSNLTKTKNILLNGSVLPEI